MKLPWRTVYELTRLTDAAFARALASGEITEGMKRDEAKRFVDFQVQIDEKRRVLVPVYRNTEGPEPHVAVPRGSAVSYGPPSVASGRRGYIYVENEQEAEAPRLVHSASPKPADDDVVVSMVLPQVERAVGELASAVERDEVMVDADFRKRVKVVADRLLSLIGRDDTPIN